MAKILISGGSGLIGKAITALFIHSGHHVQWLSRRSGEWKGIKIYKWDWTKNEIDEEAFIDVDVLINLAGAGIVDEKWTKAYKKTILDSRIKSCELLLSCIQKNNIHLKTFIGASAVGYYGSEISDRLMDENAKAGSDFMSEICARWEQSYEPFAEFSEQKVVFRIGIVLDKNGGALKKLRVPFKFGLGSALASGNQYFPWIHIQDLANLFLFVIHHNQVKGTYNAVSSQIISNAEFSRALAKSMHRPYFLPSIPRFLLKIILGERHVTVTSGLKISNHKILQSGFEFNFPKIDEALNHLNH